jgi:HlyD family secretion protein
VKKKVLAIVLAIVVVLGGIGGYLHFRSAASTAEESGNAVETVSVEKKDIENTTMVTGTISSAQTASEAPKTTNSYPVKSVNVKVGDEVKKGDLLYTLDMSTVENDLKTQEATASAQSAQDADSINNASRQVSEAQTQADYANQAAATEYNNAVEDQTIAQNTLTNAQTALSAAQDAENEALAAYNNAKNKRQTTVQNTEESETEDTYTDAEIADLKEAYDNAVSQRQSAETAVSDANTALTTANRAVQTAEQNMNSTAASGASSVASSQDAVDSAQLSAASSNLTTQDTINKDKEELTKAEVYASMDGTVTAVNVEEGQAYSGTDGVVINNTGELVASANVDEAVISKIKVGMPVRITTEATGDTVLEGSVSFISPTATKNSSNSQNSSTDQSTATSSVSTERATYRVDVTISDKNENVLLGMTAKMNFVLESAENAIVVPTADISVDASGNASVFKVEEDGSVNEISVKTGIVNDYYTQITSKNLEEGDQIQAITSDQTGDEDALTGVG